MHRLALAQAVLLVLVVILALPIAFRSMGIVLTERQEHTLYEFPGGAALSGEDADALEQIETFFNIAAIELDEAGGNISLAVSGHRICDDACPTLDLTLFSLDDDAEIRRALPPSATINLKPEDEVFSTTVNLPVRGQPSLYPFDEYTLWMGLTLAIELDGERVFLDENSITDHADITVQNQLRDYTMAPPLTLDLADVQGMNDPLDFLGAQRLYFDRPVHMEIMTVLLVTLIAVSAVLAIALRGVSDLIVGIGGLVLGIWGVRSVLVPQPLPVVTSVDLALSVIILFVLLGLSVRTAQHVHQQSDLPPLKIRRRKP